MENQASGSVSLPPGYIPQNQRKKILLLCDDIRMHSGIATMAREFVVGTAHKFNWAQIAGSIQHPDKGKIFNVDKATSEFAGIPDGYTRLYPVDGYGNPDLLDAMIAKEKSLTYANKVAQKLDYQINNHANSGSSMYTITKSIIEKRLLNNFKDSIVFYQPTSMDRFCQYINGDWADIVFSNIQNYTYRGTEFLNFCKNNLLAHLSSL